MKFNPTAVIVTVVGVLLAVAVRRCRAATAWYNNQTEVDDYRGGRFLFDALFGLDTAGFSLGDDDGPEATNQVRGCDCGKFSTNSQICFKLRIPNVTALLNKKSVVRT